MDRTQDSDSWGVGSIPAGCIVISTPEDGMKEILDNKTFINAHLLKHGLADVDCSIEFKYQKKFEKLVNA